VSAVVLVGILVLVYVMYKGRNWQKNAEVKTMNDNNNSGNGRSSFRVTQTQTLTLSNATVKANVHDSGGSSDHIGFL